MIGRLGLLPAIKAFRRARTSRSERRRRAREAASASPVRISQFGNQACAHSLTWQADSPPALSGPRYSCQWRGMHAGTDESTVSRMPPLMAVAGHAADKATEAEGGSQKHGHETVILAVDDSREKLWWGGIMHGGAPASSSEFCFPDRDGFVAWIQTECADFGIHRVYAFADKDPDLPIAVPCLHMRLKDVQPDYVLPPIFRRRLQPVMFRTIAGGALLSGLAAAAWLVWADFQTSRSVETAVQMVSYEVPLSVLASGCTRELSRYWPRPPGWEVDATGCIAAGMSDPAGGRPPPDAGAAYRTFRLLPQHNAVLATAAAELLYEDWDGIADASEAGIVLKRRFELTPRRADESLRRPTTEALAAAMQTHFLGLADEVTFDGRTVTLRSTAAISTLLDRLQALDRRMPLSLRRLSRQSGTVEMDVTARQYIMKPLDDS